MFVTMSLGNAGRTVVESPRRCASTLDRSSIAPRRIDAVRLERIGDDRVACWARRMER